jgi:hypothetical protein
MKKSSICLSSITQEKKLIVVLQGKEEEDLKKLTPASKEYKELQADITETKRKYLLKLYDYAAKR